MLKLRHTLREDKSLLQLQCLFHSTARWRSGEIDDPSYAGLYFLHWQAASHGGRAASRRFKADPRPDPTAWLDELAYFDAEETRLRLIRCFERYQFLGVIANATAALAAWLRQEWPLTLCEHVPQPREVLQMQMNGTRPVTVIGSWPDMLDPVLGKPNAFAFMVHDLEHAWKFYHDPEMHRQQCALFRVLHDAMESSLFTGYLRDCVFASKFNYLIGDMNTHTMHASQFLRAILVEYHLRREGRRDPDALSHAARQEVSGLMATLLGDDWRWEVERRMIRGGTPPIGVEGAIGP